LIPLTSPRMSNGTDAIPATENWSLLAYVFKIRKVKRLQMLGDANVFRGFAEFGRCGPGRRGCLSGDGTHSRNHSRNPKTLRFLIFGKGVSTGSERIGSEYAHWHLSCLNVRKKCSSAHSVPNCESLASEPMKKRFFSRICVDFEP
jgi:hypothetical protein